MGSIQSVFTSDPSIQALQYAAPADGGTVTVSADASFVVLEPAGALVALTVNLPATAPLGKVITVSCSAAVTTLTLGAGAATVVGALAAFVTNGFARYVFRSSKWYRCG